MWKFWRYVPALALTAALILLLTGVAVAIHTERTHVTQHKRGLLVQARILASSVTAALTFSDPETAREYVGALGTNPEIEAAAVYDGKGAMFAGFHRDAAPPAPAALLPGADPSETDDGQAVTLPVIANREQVGTVYLRSAPEDWQPQFARFGGVAGLFVMSLVIVAVLGAAQTTLARANRELAEQARDLSEANDRLEGQIRERERVEATLRQVHKMETIGQLTGGVAHDFNNLLTIILGNLHRLQRRLIPEGDAARIQNAITGALHGAERAASLTRSLLAFSRRQPLEPRPVDVNRLIAGMTELVRRTLGEQVRVEIRPAADLWPSLVDANQLENAILNLAVNARDAMPQGGRLAIETANVMLEGGGTPDVPPGQYVCVTVRDTGTGMTPEVAAQAFEPFFTTKGVGHGTGLGLSQVYGFIRQTGGQVVIDSVVGAGTAVKIYLPRLHDAEAFAEDSAGPGPDLGNDATRASAGERVLVVEDDPDVRAHSVETLRDLGYRIVEAADGAAALAILAREPAIDLLFTDIGLPGGMNGRELADEAQRRYPGLRVLFTTAYARDTIIHDGRLDPGVHLLNKPFTEPELSQAVRRAIGERRDGHAILLVEDEPLVRIDTAMSMAELGYAILEAASAQAAEKLMQARGGDVAAVVIDVGLPDRPGDDLAVALRRQHPQLPIVIASGYSVQAISGRFRHDRRVAFVGKPYGLGAMEAALESLGVRRRADSEAAGEVSSPTST